MTAPTRSRAQSRPRPAQRTSAPAKPAKPTKPAKPAAPPAKSEPSRTTTRKRSGAAERAYARRAQRVSQLERMPEGQRQRLFRLPTSRASFVLLLMALLAGGVAATLWLSTQAITDSYRLERLRADNAALEERSEELRRQVARQESPSKLAERARELGMVPGGNPARLVVSPKGDVRVVGKPSEAKAPPPPPPPEPRHDEPAQRQGQQTQQTQQTRQARQGEQPGRQGTHAAGQQERGGAGGE